MRPAFLAMAMLAALLAGCAGNPGARATTATATATDEAPDRILVTVDANVLANAAGLSPSGRPSYVPPDPAAVRDMQQQRARAIADEFALRLEDDWPIPALGIYCFVFRLQNPNIDQRDTVIAALSRRPGVESVQPLNFFHTRTDPLGSIADAPVVGPSGLYSHASGKGVRIAIIDTGADLRHEDLAGANVTAFDLVGNAKTLPAEFHGTAVLGLIAARRDNGKGIGGYAPDADILLLRACWQPRPHDEYAVCNSFTLAKALSQALESDADIVNLSVSGPRDPLLERLAELFAEDDQLLVAAGGSRETFPASVSGSVVAARLIDATRGMTLLPGNRYGLRGGSSLQAARVSGIAALIHEIAPRTGAEELHERLVRLRSETLETAFADLLPPPADSRKQRTTKASAAR